MRKIEKFITSIDYIVTADKYLFRGDGHGDFEKLCDDVACPKIIEDYIEYLEEQLSYAKLSLDAYKSNLED